MSTSTKPVDLSDEYWARLSAGDQALYAIIRPQPKAAWQVDQQLGYIEKFIAETTRDMVKMGGTFELNPDFQRGHVWTPVQQIRYVESLLREQAPTRILFNCPGWVSSAAVGDIPPHTFQCIDGLQRLTAIRSFMADELKVFGRFTASDLAGTPFSPSRYRIQVCMYQFSSRADLLRFYIDLNVGGTVHTDEEIERVRELLAAASGEAS